MTRDLLFKRAILGAADKRKDKRVPEVVEEPALAPEEDEDKEESEQGAGAGVGVGAYQFGPQLFDESALVSLTSVVMTTKIARPRVYSCAQSHISYS